MEKERINRLKKYLLIQKKRFPNIKITIEYQEWLNYLSVEIKFYLQEKPTPIGVGITETIEIEKLRSNLYFYQQIDNQWRIFNRLITNYNKSKERENEKK